MKFIPETADVNVLVIGHGIAGAMVAWELYKKGVPFHIIDDSCEKSASRVSSGLINPVTGRHYALSWRVEELLPYATSTYDELCNFLKLDNVTNSTVICRTLPGIASENDWVARMNQDRYSKYLSLWTDNPPFRLSNRPEALGKISNVLQVNKKRLLHELTEHWRKLGVITEQKVPIEKLAEGNGSYRLGDRQFNVMICCEGYNVSENPFFNYLPIEPTKGEVMYVRVQNQQGRAILKDQCFVIPWRDDICWVGSNYEKYPDSTECNEAEQEKLLVRLKNSISSPVEVVDRTCGIRPASEDRKPMLGGHPTFKGLYILNGLGTKGTQLAPFFARQLVNHIVDGSEIDKEVDINRFQ